MNEQNQTILQTNQDSQTLQNNNLQTDQENHTKTKHIRIMSLLMKIQGILMSLSFPALLLFPITLTLLGGDGGIADFRDVSLKFGVPWYMSLILSLIGVIFIITAINFKKFKKWSLFSAVFLSIFSILWLFPLGLPTGLLLSIYYFSVLFRKNTLEIFNIRNRKKFILIVSLILLSFIIFISYKGLIRSIKYLNNPTDTENICWRAGGEYTIQTVEEGFGTCVYRFNQSENILDNALGENQSAYCDCGKNYCFKDNKCIDYWNDYADERYHQKNDKLDTQGGVRYNF